MGTSLNRLTLPLAWKPAGIKRQFLSANPTSNIFSSTTFDNNSFGFLCGRSRLEAVLPIEMPVEVFAVSDP